jgi:hypothetical protein
MGCLHVAERRELREERRSLRGDLNVIFKAVHRIDTPDKENVADTPGASQGFISKPEIAFPRIEKHPNRLDNADSHRHVHSIHFS